MHVHDEDDGKEDDELHRLAGDGSIWPNRAKDEALVP